MQEIGEERMSEGGIKEHYGCTRRLRRGKGVMNFMLQWLSSFCDHSAAGIRQWQKRRYNLLTNPARVVRVHVCYCEMISGRSLAESRKVEETRSDSEGTSLLQCLNDARFPRCLDPSTFSPAC